MYPVFRKACETILLNWDIVQFSIENETGGRQSKEIADWMVGVVEQYFYDNHDVGEAEIGEYIGEILDAELNSQIDEPTEILIGKDLRRMYMLCCNGESAKAEEELLARPQKSHNQQSRVIESDDESQPVPELVNAQFNSMDINDSATNQPQNLSDLARQQLQDEEDGWSVVRKKNHRY